MSEPDHRAVIERVMDERDRLYDTRFKAAETAMSAALVAQERFTAAAFLSSEKAIQKAETNAEKWRENANEWRSAMMDRETKFASRSEVEARFETVLAAIASLKETRAEAHGGKAFKDDSRATIAMVLSVIGLVVVVVRAFVK